MDERGLTSLPPGGAAVVIGSSGGIGSALTGALGASGRFAKVVGLSRTGKQAVDITDEASIARAASHVAAMGLPVRLVIVATGMLHGPSLGPEKSWRELDGAALAEIFAVNATGAALVIKHFAPLLARAGKAVIAAISAKVGSIGDNRLGGWYGYRASKAALNQIVRTASIELKRTRPEALCLALHPGTVETRLSQPFRRGPTTVGADVAARRLLGVIDRAGTAQSGMLLDHDGSALPF